MTQTRRLPEETIARYGACFDKKTVFQLEMAVKVEKDVNQKDEKTEQQDIAVVMQKITMVWYKAVMFS